MERGVRSGGESSGPTDSSRWPDGGDAAVYLAEVVEQLGLPVDRAVLGARHGGRIVFDPPAPSGDDAVTGERAPTVASWDPGWGWDVRVVGPRAAVTHAALTASAHDPSPTEVATFVARCLAEPGCVTAADAAC